MIYKSDIIGLQFYTYHYRPKISIAFSINICGTANVSKTHVTANLAIISVPNVPLPKQYPLIVVCKLQHYNYRPL